MLSYYFQGLALGAAMILPLGPQDISVMNQSIRRQYHIIIALFRVISDLVLVYAGISGDSTSLMQLPWLLVLVTWGDAVFLLWYGFGAFKTAMSSNIGLASAEVLKQDRWKIIAAMLTVTWLNPYAYLDTFIVLGSLDGQLDVESKHWFVFEAISTSFLWFSGLAILATWLVPRLHTARSQRIISLVVGCVIWFIALQPARDDIAHAQALFSQTLSDGKIRQRC